MDPSSFGILQINFCNKSVEIPLKVNLKSRSMNTRTDLTFMTY